MPETSHLDSLNSLRLLSVKAKVEVIDQRMWELIGRLESLERLVTGLLTLRPGAPSSPQPHPSPTPGTLASTQKPTPTKLAQALGDWERISKLLNLLLGAIRLAVIIGPWLLVAWRWLVPFLLRLPHG